jgi:hypothetical protein
MAKAHGFDSFEIADADGVVLWPAAERALD